jgi:uncharacterized protein (TIGR02246 family)
MITKESTGAAQAVRDVLAGTMKAWEAHDADAFVEHYTPDATVVLSGGVFLRGREAVRSFMADSFAGRLAGSRAIDEPESVRVTGDTAVVVSRAGILNAGEDTLPADRLRRATWTLTRHDGWWLVEAYANSTL